MSLIGVALTKVYQFLLHLWSLLTCRHTSSVEPDLELGIASPHARNDIPAVVPEGCANNLTHITDDLPAELNSSPAIENMPTNAVAIPSHSPAINFAIPKCVSLADLTTPQYWHLSALSSVAAIDRASRFPAPAPATPRSPSLHLDIADLSTISAASSSPPKTPTFADTLAAFPEPPPFATSDDFVLSSPRFIIRHLEVPSTPPYKDLSHVLPTGLTHSFSKLLSSSPGTPDKASAFASKLVTLIRPSTNVSTDTLPEQRPFDMDVDPFCMSGDSFFGDCGPVDLADMVLPHPNLYDLSVYATPSPRGLSKARSPSFRPARTTFIADISQTYAGRLTGDDAVLPLPPALEPMWGAPDVGGSSYLALGTRTLPIGAPRYRYSVVFPQLARASLSDTAPHHTPSTLLPAFESVTHAITSPVPEVLTVSSMATPETSSQAIEEEPPSSSPLQEAHSKEKEEETVATVADDAVHDASEAAENRRSRQLDDIVSLLDQLGVIGGDAQPADREHDAANVTLSDSTVLPVLERSASSSESTFSLPAGSLEDGFEEWEGEDFDEFVEPREHRMSRSIENLISLLEECRDSVPVTESHASAEDSENDHADAHAL
ncbi:hypothetical protein SCP_1801590 [Sparassis crispa]|uniref:Uncharacterized protein n=1 Tax=Sparassis crispa TaxID=139825 RepID=A0A401H6S5_9APHY|nr:hypothetical protein SCP_1801590 [Sparassis crispa]GBE90135.1 hypothetical protein SCP_1801590 [Sparassis crispa]